MKNVVLLVIGAVIAGAFYYIGMGAGANRAMSGDVPSVYGKTASVEDATQLESIEARLAVIEKATAEISANHNGLVEGLKKEISTINSRSGSVVVGMSLLERIVKKHLGERKYDSYLNESRDELNEQIKMNAKDKESKKEEVKQ